MFFHILFQWVSAAFFNPTVNQISKDFFLDYVYVRLPVYGILHVSTVAFEARRSCWIL